VGLDDGDGRQAPIRTGASTRGGGMSDIILESEITCPHCGVTKRETMPLDACQFYYECGNCKRLLRPKSGDCCVFCSFGSVKCPPVQQQRGCC
jgi:hypothetical protein